MESTFSKATEKISVFFIFVEKSITGIGIFQKVALLKISGNFLLIRAIDLHSASCSATKNVS